MTGLYKTVVASRAVTTALHEAITAMHIDTTAE